MAGSPPPQEDIMQQAHHVWAMLDDMADNDPTAYRKFINKQLEEGKESLNPPEPHMCIQTVIKEPSDATLFINVFEWQRIPAPKDDAAPIPVMGGPVYWAKDENDKYRCAAVAFNPKVLDDFGINSKLVEERRLLINLAIDYLQDQHKMQISRHYTLLNKQNSCKGSVKLARQSLLSKTKEKDDQFEQQLTDLEKTFGPVAQDCKDSLINQLSNLTTNDKTPETVPFGNATSSDQSELRMPGDSGKSKAGLVQEITDTGEVKDPEPLYDIQTVADQSGGQKIVLKVQLPGVKSVSECELDISPEDVSLIIPCRYNLQLNLPQTVDGNSASAKFSKKSSTLALTLSCLAAS